MLILMSEILDGVTTELLGGIGIELSEESKDTLFQLVDGLIAKNDYFQSFDEGYTYINGNVSKKGHITVCTGIYSADVKKKFDHSELKISQSSCTIKEIQINLGYQELYYIIVAIPQVESEILLFNDWIRKNTVVHAGAPEFDPHITLCYIKNQGQYPAVLYQEFKKALVGKKLDFKSIHFSVPYTKEKETLIQF